mmetsp:Transcript_23890/g.43282  ORF Transcript_23890/g.43282 Transcript_23890/m.43282 type:complete len:442 (-) Transcript_23890:229-1554(-)
MVARIVEGELGVVRIALLARAVIHARLRWEKEKFGFDTKKSHLVQRLKVGSQEGIIISGEDLRVVTVVGMRTRRWKCEDDVGVKMLLVSGRIGEPIREYDVEWSDAGRRIGYKVRDIICDNIIDQKMMKVVVESGTLWSVSICATCHPRSVPALSKSVANVSNSMGANENIGFLFCKAIKVDHLVFDLISCSHATLNGKWTGVSRVEAREIMRPFGYAYVCVQASPMELVDDNVSFFLCSDRGHGRLQGFRNIQLAMDDVEDGELEHVGAGHVDAGECIVVPKVLDGLEGVEWSIQEAILGHQAHGRVIEQATIGATFARVLIERSGIMKSGPRKLTEQRFVTCEEVFHDVNQDSDLALVRDRGRIFADAPRRRARGRPAVRRGSRGSRRGGIDHASAWRVERLLVADAGAVIISLAFKFAGSRRGRGRERRVWSRGWSRG